MKSPIPPAHAQRLLRALKFQRFEELATYILLIDSGCITVCTSKTRGVSQLPTHQEIYHPRAEATNRQASRSLADLYSMSLWGSSDHLWQLVRFSLFLMAG